jgi:hypothetical protein
VDLVQHGADEAARAPIAVAGDGACHRVDPVAMSEEKRDQNARHHARRRGSTRIIGPQSEGGADLGQGKFDGAGRSEDYQHAQIAFLDPSSGSDWVWRFASAPSAAVPALFSKKLARTVGAAIAATVRIAGYRPHGLSREAVSRIGFRRGCGRWGRLRPRLFWRGDNAQRRGVPLLGQPLEQNIVVSKAVAFGLF